MWRQVGVEAWARDVEVCGKIGTAQVEPRGDTYVLKVVWDGAWHVLITGYESAALARYALADGIFGAIAAAARGEHLVRERSEDLRLQRRLQRRAV